MDFKQFVSCRSQRDLKEFSNIKIGEKAKYLFIPGSYAELQLLISRTGDLNKELIPLGGCSNILFGDVGDRILIMDQKLPTSYQIKNNEVIVTANYKLGSFISELQKHDLGGLEFLAGIPAHIGGAVFMNAGAFGSSISQFVNWVEMISSNGNVQKLPKRDIHFDYRNSTLNGFITKISFCLNKRSKKKLSSDLQNFIRERKKRHPANFPCLGSFFKNPEGNIAGKLIEECGLKGKKFGDAVVSPKHANFVINVGNATFQNVMDLIKLCRQTVLAQTGIDLKLEIKVIDR
ncbi:MAG: UDP-N-acetylmuramate dehydrogenase [Candidatus Cloacimonetes bacterium]|nr:UDP-N-acetylmuramate dehydrogenase [Candidatus Cloacimonadota bacterium]